MRQDIFFCVSPTKPQGVSAARHGVLSRIRWPACNAAFGWPVTVSFGATFAAFVVWNRAESLFLAECLIRVRKFSSMSCSCTTISVLLRDTKIVIEIVMDNAVIQITARLPGSR